MAIPKVVLQNAAIRLFWGNMEKEMKLCFKSFGDQYVKKYDFLSRTSKIGIFGANRAYKSIKWAWIPEEQDKYTMDTGQSNLSHQ